MAVDRLSTLPDAVLTRVLSFLNLGDAVRTGWLSRRWRALWRQADALNLDSEEYPDHGLDGERVGREFFSDALAAVGADGRCPVRKLSVCVYSSYQNAFLRDIMRTSPGMDALLAAPAMRRLEELRVSCSAEFIHTCEEYVLAPAQVPATCLRLLDLDGCALGPPGTTAAAAVFGRLETLRMTNCVTSPESLQAMLDASPNLADLCLRWVFLTSESESMRELLKRRVLLRCPETTIAVTLMHCHRTDGLYLDAPSVRSLRYVGFPEHFPFTSTTPANLLHMELGFCKARCSPYRLSQDDMEPRAIFWESIGRFRGLRLLKLKLQGINGVAVHPDQEEVLLRVFPDLKFLELKGSYEEKDSYAAAVAMANLLQCCPSMEELHIKLKRGSSDHPKPWVFRSDEREAQVSLEESMKLLKRIRSKASTAASSGGDICDDVELSALRARSFHCLDHCLRKIRIEFDLERFSCFEVKLAKFLVENAVVLEEMEVHDGDQRVIDHIHYKLAGWRANSSKRKIKIIGEHSKGSS